MNTYAVYLYTILFLFGFAACDREDDNNFPVDDYVIEFGSEIIVDDVLSVRFDSIQDSRCPTNINCIWQGVAEVWLAVGENGESETLKFCNWDTDGKVEDCETERSFGNYRLELLEVSPYPENPGVLTQEDYTILMLIEPN